MNNDDHNYKYIGWISIIIAIISFGFLSSPMKIKRVRNADPMFIQFFMSLPIIFFSFLPLIFKEFRISWPGMFGGLLWVPASCLSIFSVQLIGISMAQTIWSGTTAITSFLIGIIAFKEKFKTLYYPIIGLIGLVFGIGLISINFKRKINFFCCCTKKSYLSINKEEFANDLESNCILEKSEPNKQKNGKCIKAPKIIGVICSIAMGIINAVSMVPVKCDSELIYITSFGISQFIVGSITILLYFITKLFVIGELKEKRKDVKYSVYSGILCGFIWTVGYYSQFFAVVYLGLALGLPLIQSTIIISSIVGVLFFKELHNCKQQIQLWIGIVIILISSFFLSIAKA